MYINTVIKTTSFGDDRLSVVGMAGWPAGRWRWAWSASQEQTLSGTDTEQYRCACLHWTQRLAGCGDRYQCDLDRGVLVLDVWRGIT